MRWVSRFAYGWLLMVMLPVFLFAGNKKGKQKTHHPAKRAIRDHVIINSECNVVPLNIKAATIGQKGMAIDVPFKQVEVLKKLIPGRYVHFPNAEDTDDTMDLVIWRSNDMPKKIAHSWWGSINEVFPYVNGCVTETKDTLQFTDDKGGKNIILSLSTHDGNNTECMFCGRGECVSLGLAWFKLHNNKWILVDFNPFFGCFGQFQALPKIQLTQLGNNNYGCYLYNYNGGAGGVYYADLHLFGLINGRIKNILTEERVIRCNTYSSEWSNKLHAENGSLKKTFEPFQLILSGKFTRYAPDLMDDSTDSPIELAKAILNRDSFDFKVVRTFTFNNGKYHKTKTQVEVK